MNAHLLFGLHLPDSLLDFMPRIVIQLSLFNQRRKMVTLIDLQNPFDLHTSSIFKAALKNFLMS